MTENAISRATEAEAAERGTVSGVLLSAGGILGAIAASSCCVLPLALVSVGITGSWMVNLTALAPYQPYFLVFAVTALGAGFYLSFRKPNAEACAVDGSCSTSRSRKITRSLLWTGTVIVVIGAAVPYAAPLFY